MNNDNKTSNLYSLYQQQSRSRTPTLPSSQITPLPVELKQKQNEPPLVWNKFIHKTSEDGFSASIGKRIHQRDANFNNVGLIDIQMRRPKKLDNQKNKSNQNTKNIVVYDKTRFEQQLRNIKNQKFYSLPHYMQTNQISYNQL